MGFCGTCNVNHDGKQSTCSSYCYLHSGMFMAGQYSVPDNGAGGVGKEGQVKIV